MKNLVLILLSFCSIIVFSQEIVTKKDGQQVVLFSDGTWKNWGEEKTETQTKKTYPDYDSESFFWEDGYDNIVEVVFTNYIKSDNIVISDFIISSVVIDLMIKSKYSLKNKLSYVPKEVTLMSTIKPSEENKRKKKKKRRKKGDTEKNIEIEVEKMDTTFTGIITYYGKNSYGTEGESKCFNKFTLKGDIESIGCN